MKRYILAIMLLLISVGAAMADTTVQVMQGDTLSGLGKKHGVAWQDIAKANGLASPYVIRVGQNLAIPEKSVNKPDTTRALVFRWTHVGSAPFNRWSVEALQQAIGKFMLPEGVKSAFRAQIGSSDWREGVVKNGDFFDQMIFRNFAIKDNVLADFSGDIPAMVYRPVAGGYQLVIPYACANVCWRQGVTHPEVSLDSVLPVPLPVDHEDNATDVIAGIRQGDNATGINPSSVERDKPSSSVRLDAGSGTYFKEYGPGNGYYGWFKFRYQPFTFGLWENATMDLGMFAFFAGGQGVDGSGDEAWKYRWNEFALGPSVRVSGDGWDADIDIGFGELFNAGHNNWAETDQTDDIALYSVHYNNWMRRAMGEEWFSKFELNFEYRDILSSDVSGASEAYDNRSLELTWHQLIYDFHFGEEDKCTLSPAWNLGFGREFGLGSDFLKLGPGLDFEYHDYKIVELSILNYKEQFGVANGGQWHPLSISLSIHGLYRLFKEMSAKNVTGQDVLDELTRQVSDGTESAMDSFRASARLGDDAESETPFICRDVLEVLQN